MFNSKHFRKLLALTTALALTATVGLSVMAQAETTKHFSVIEAASDQDSLSEREISKQCSTTNVASEPEAPEARTATSSPTTTSSPARTRLRSM